MNRINRVIGICGSLASMTGRKGPVIGAKLLSPEQLYAAAKGVVDQYLDEGHPSDEYGGWSVTLPASTHDLVSSGIARTSRKKRDYHLVERFGRMLACRKRDAALEVESVSVTVMTVAAYRKHELPHLAPDEAISAEELNQLTHVITYVRVMAGPVDKQPTQTPIELVSELARQYLRQDKLADPRVALKQLQRLLKRAWCVDTYARDFSLVADQLDA